ncbi:MAG: DEAD/DEAH box helicase [Candidatus Methanoplasma sp.]|nr:DEAD/DEAH box helicase [Candidatus Methanoplasma sp.]
MVSFRDLGVGDSVADAIGEIGWTEPTPVQEAAIPAGLSGRDIFAQAQTGTGKTGTYAAILLGRIKSGSRSPSAIVLAPTRELAVQIELEIKKLSKYSKHRSAAIYGGASISDQIYRLNRGVDIVVGTPGRIKDMVERRVLNLTAIKEAVIDEADRMLDMGFAEELDFIIDSLPTDRQTMLFSATMADDVMKMAMKITDEPLELMISKDEPCSDLTVQYYIPVSRSGKLERLQMILRNGNPKVIVFCQTKKMVDDLYNSLCRDFRIEAIHGDMPQGKREKVIRNFRNDRFDVLIATDVVARGLDVNNVDCVVNYDVPADSETYLHRIGRTGRAGKEGIAVSFVTKYEDHRIGTYERATGKKITKIRVDQMGPIERTRSEIHISREESPAGAYRPRGSAKPSIWPEHSARPEKQNTAESRKRGSTMFILQVNLGKIDGVGRMQITDLIRKNTELSRDMIGRIGLGKTCSYFEINGDRAEYVIDTLSDCRYGNKKVCVQLAPQKRSYAENAA